MGSFVVHELIPLDVHIQHNNREYFKQLSSYSPTVGCCCFGLSWVSSIDWTNSIDRRVSALTPIDGNKWVRG